MPKDIFDFTNYRETRSDRIPPDTYNAVITFIEKKRTRADDADMYEIGVEITDGEHSGAFILDRLVQKQAAMFRTAAFLRGMGVSIKRKRFQLDMQKFVGRQVTVEVADGRQQGDFPVTSEIKGWATRSKASGSAAAAAESSDLEDLDADAPVTDDSGPADGAEEFAADTTQNPSDEVAEARAKKAPAADKAEPDTVDTPETVDLDDIEL